MSGPAAAPDRGRPSPDDGLHWITRPGARIAWRTDGSPDLPVLLVGNALGTDHHAWDGVLAPWMAHFRVVRFDARGHGASPVDASWRGRDYTIELLAQDALAVADAAGAPRFHWLGLSIGGMLGLWLASEAADRLDRLAVSNTAARLPAEVWAERIAAVRAGGMQALVDSTMQRWFTPAFHARQDPQIAAARAAFLQLDPEAYCGCAAAIRDMDLHPALARISTPTLVIAGALDPSTPPALGRAIQAGIGHAEWLELPAAHMPQRELPDLFGAAVSRFLGAA
ncbi:MAG: 3-oxoadipate enol-lactonase [Rhodoferax sp.]|nr:3-oxoadipate enol-lactonase [Rhodoferax sp.]